MTTVTIDGFDFVLSEGSHCILVFKGDALADSHCCSSRAEAVAVFEKVKKAKHVLINSQEVKNPWPAIAEAELPELKDALDKAMSSNSKKAIGAKQE